MNRKNVEFNQYIFNVLMAMEWFQKKNWNKNQSRVLYIGGIKVTKYIW